MPATISKNSQKARKSAPISFRLDSKHDEALVSKFKETPVVGINSPDKFARKLVMDVLQGKVVYLNPADRLANPALT